MPDQRAFQGDAFEQDAFQAPLVVDTGATIASGESFGRPTGQRVGRTVGVSSTETLGAAKIARLAAAAGIVSTQALGQAAVTQLLRPAGIGSAETFGWPFVSRPAAVSAIAATETFGVPTLPRVTRAQPSSSGETFGAVAALRLVAGHGISTGAQLGQPQIAVGAAPFSGVVATGSIGSSETFGTPTLSLATQTGGSGLQHGINYVHTVRHTAPLEHRPSVALRVGSIDSTETFGTPTVDIAAPDRPQPRIPERKAAVPDRDTLLLVGAL